MFHIVNGLLFFRRSRTQRDALHCFSAGHRLSEMLRIVYGYLQQVNLLVLYRFISKQLLQLCYNK